jgi:hypothetical protein
MENLTLDEIRELKMAVNALIAQRITYSISVKEGSEREKEIKGILIWIINY